MIRWLKKQVFEQTEDSSSDENERAIDEFMKQDYSNNAVNIIFGSKIVTSSMLWCLKKYSSVDKSMQKSMG